MNLADRNTRAMLGYKLESQTTDEIDLNLLKAYLEATEKYGNTTVSIRYRALKLKYEALTTVPTSLEKTMSPAQLYASGEHFGRIATKELQLNEFSESFVRGQEPKKTSIECSPSLATQPRKELIKWTQRTK